MEEGLLVWGIRLKIFNSSGAVNTVLSKTVGLVGNRSLCKNWETFIAERSVLFGGNVGYRGLQPETHKSCFYYLHLESLFKILIFPCQLLILPLVPLYQLDATAILCAPWNNGTCKHKLFISAKDRSSIVTPGVSQEHLPMKSNPNMLKILQFC